MQNALLGLALALAVLASSRAPALADDPGSDDEPVVTADDAEVYIEAPGVEIAIDQDQRAIDIRAGNTHVYADESGKVDIRTPGLTIRADPK